MLTLYYLPHRTLGPYCNNNTWKQRHGGQCACPRMVAELNVYIYRFLVKIPWYHFFFPASGRKSWSYVSYLLPPLYMPSFCRAVESVLPLIVDFHQILPTHALALFFPSQFLHPKRTPYALGEGFNSRSRPLRSSLLDSQLDHRGYCGSNTLAGPDNPLITRVSHVPGTS